MTPEEWGAVKALADKAREICDVLQHEAHRDAGVLDFAGPRPAWLAVEAPLHGAWAKVEAILRRTNPEAYGNLEDDP